MIEIIIENACTQFRNDEVDDFFNPNFKTTLNDTVVTNAYICKSKSKTKLIAHYIAASRVKKIH